VLTEYLNTYRILVEAVSGLTSENHAHKLVLFVCSLGTRNPVEPCLAFALSDDLDLLEEADLRWVEDLEEQLIVGVLPPGVERYV